MKSFAATFALAAAMAGCASLGSNAPAPEFNRTDECIERRAREEANAVFGSHPHMGAVRIEPLMFREIVRECSHENSAGPSYYRGEETVVVPRHGRGPY